MAHEWTEVLARVSTRHDLSREDTAWVMEQILTDQAPLVSVAGVLVALRTKGETADEVAGFAQTMLAHATRITVPGRTLDLVGTGGDGHHTVNVSSMASLVVAGAGVTVVKHGNRAASSLTGTADVLEELGIPLDLSPQRVAEVAVEAGITFCFAPVFHPSMRFAAPIRKELGIPTVFNVLGPLCNPAQPTASAIGVGHPTLGPVMAGVFAAQGRDALLFRNHDGLDELAATADATLWEVRDGVVTEHHLDPRSELDMTPIALADLRGGDRKQNAEVARQVLRGTRGPIRETVVLNAAAGLVADGTTPGTGEGSLVQRLEAGIAAANASLDSGAAQASLERWVRAANA